MTFNIPANFKFNTVLKLRSSYETFYRTNKGTYRISIKYFTIVYKNEENFGII